VDRRRLGLDGSPTQVIKVFTPDLRKAGEMISADTPEEIARILRTKLKEAGFAI